MLLEEFLDVPSPTSCLGLQERSAMGLPRSWGSDPAVHCPFSCAMAVSLAATSTQGANSTQELLPLLPFLHSQPPHPEPDVFSFGRGPKQPLCRPGCTSALVDPQFGFYQQHPDMWCLKGQHQGNVCKMLLQYPGLCQHLQRNWPKSWGSELPIPHRRAAETALQSEMALEW